MMPRACRNAMPAAISAAVVSSAAILGRSGPREGGIRNAPRLMASCSVPAT